MAKWIGANLNDTVKMADSENPLGYKNLGIISYRNQVLANMAAMGASTRYGCW